MAFNVTFIYCIERGELEKQTLLSIQSLRKFGGIYKDSEILAVAPRKARGISIESESLLKEWNVTYINKPINQKYSNFGLYNKPIVCAYAEEVASGDYLVFVDSDTVIINALDSLIKDVDIQSAPVLVKNVGYESEEDSNYQIWKHFYDIFGLRKDVQITTLMGNKAIYAYWNSGVIVVKNGKGIFKLWKKYFEEIVAQKQVFPDKLKYFIEQFSWSILIKCSDYSFQELENKFNYHISNHHDLDKLYREESYDNLNILHYHAIFKFSSWKNPLPALSDHEGKRKWITSKLKTYNLFPLSASKRVRHSIGNPWYRFKQRLK